MELPWILREMVRYNGRFGDLANLQLKRVEYIQLVYYPAAAVHCHCNNTSDLIRCSKLHIFNGQIYVLLRYCDRSVCLCVEMTIFVIKMDSQIHDTFLFILPDLQLCYLGCVQINVTSINFMKFAKLKPIFGK